MSNRKLGSIALAQPEFIKHEVENADDWSEWVCPDPKNYLMKCCDCGLVHEAQFGVVRYKSETEDCDIVDDPNLQAVFRMRRSEEWTPEDTAHRAGGLPMAQPEQEPTPWRDMVVVSLVREGIDKHRARELADHFAAQRPLVDLTDNDWGWIADRKGTALDTFDQGAAWAQARLKERNK